MKYETLNNVTLPKIGYGTWKLGGASTPDLKLDSVSSAAIHSALEIGYTHFDTAEMYADGHAEELLGKAIRESNVKREDLFITSKVTPSHLHHDQVLHACEKSLKKLQMDYIDLYLIHWHSVGNKYEDTFRALNKLVKDGKVKHLGVSNFDLKLLKQAQELSETPMVTNQVPYSLSDRSYVKNGVLEHCQQNNIFLTAYEPLDKGNVRSNKTLETIAKSHNKTIFQIVLAWVISQSNIITIPMSTNPQHIQENFEAAEIVLTKEEIDLISKQ